MVRQQKGLTGKDPHHTLVTILEITRPHVDTRPGWVGSCSTIRLQHQHPHPRQPAVGKGASNNCRAVTRPEVSHPHRWGRVPGYGDYSVGGTPGPIPNPEAKTHSADGTAPGRVWESRTPPDTHYRRRG